MSHLFLVQILDPAIDSTTVFDQLLERGVVVKDGAVNWRGLTDRHLRVDVNLRPHMDRLENDRGLAIGRQFQQLLNRLAGGLVFSEPQLQRRHLLVILQPRTRIENNDAAEQGHGPRQIAAVLECECVIAEQPHILR